MLIDVAQIHCPSDNYPEAEPHRMRIDTESFLSSLERVVPPLVRLDPLRGHRPVPLTHETLQFLRIYRCRSTKLSPFEPFFLP